jgi:hypothetical protein
MLTIPLGTLIHSEVYAKLRFFSYLALLVPKNIKTVHAALYIVHEVLIKNKQCIDPILEN